FGRARLCRADSLVRITISAQARHSGMPLAGIQLFLLLLSLGNHGSEENIGAGFGPARLGTVLRGCDSHVNRAAVESEIAFPQGTSTKLIASRGQGGSKLLSVVVGYDERRIRRFDQHPEVVARDNPAAGIQVGPRVPRQARPIFDFLLSLLLLLDRGHLRL